MLFTLGGVTVLLQVHIIEQVPYIVLIEQPFDSIIESRIINDQKGNQMVCITCPNTRAIVMIPTYKREVLSRRVDGLAKFW